jgi:iron complex outermembrane receptor protein
MKTNAIWLSASVFALAWCGAAAAQTAAPATSRAPAASNGSGGVQEVVVTADRRTTNLQKTAVAATVLSGADLTRKGIVTVDQLQFLSPSLTINNFGQGNDFDIRGIGKGEHNTQTTTGVVTYRDGVATFPGYFQEEPYYDIANLEILRGPQGTFAGQNATGGAVIVTTRDPTIGGGYNGYLLGRYGNYNDTSLQGAVNLPISDTLAARVAFNTEYRDSFYNIGGPLSGDRNLSYGSGRVSLLWKPTSSLTVSFKTDYNYLANGGYFGDAIINPLTGKLNPTSDLFKFNNNFRTFATDQFVRSVLKVDYVDPGTDITFRSITGYQDGRSAWKGDIDGTDLPAPNYIIDEGVKETIWSQEFNVISPSKGPITWILGTYYQSNDYNFPHGQFDIGVPPGLFDEELNGVNNTYTAAVFGQLSFNLPDGFQLQLGGRYSNWGTVNHVNYLVPEFAVNYFQNASEYGSNFTGKVALNWNIDRDNFLYAFVATGAKPGGLNTALYFANGVNFGPPPPPFRQEYVTDYEGGWKASLFDNHVHTQLGVYYNDFQHFQVIIPIPDNPVLTTEENDPTSTKLYGLEASAQGVWGDFAGNIGLGVGHSELGRFYAQDPRLATSGTCNLKTGPLTSTCLNLAGNPQTYAPDVTFDVGAQYNFHLPGGDLLTPAVSFSYISSQWATLFDNRAAGDYLAARDILGATLAWTHGSFVTTLYGTNLLNDHYVAAVLSPIQLAGPPLQFGVSVMKTF